MKKNISPSFFVLAFAKATHKKLLFLELLPRQRQVKHCSMLM
ncbi:hypothetical protein JCM19294_2019 [Nonlabens tegetincola]|uniref:Uncharacterized protein n=1 Tax=Nonlabens tegetincola TaxID=323273 RepID=A0A090QLX7_9FLAO|nr:hypothetical protein JCM19294_2019 [Nonlabens tegetincola]